MLGPERGASRTMRGGGHLGGRWGEEKSPGGQVQNERKSGFRGATLPTARRNLISYHVGGRQEWDGTGVADWG
jgi:hypothetical protein